MALRVFRASRVLKMACEVGLVGGMTAAIRPTGSGNPLLMPKARVLLNDAAGPG